MHPVKYYRLTLGLTQKYLAKKLGISYQSYWNRETGRTSFTDDEKLLILELFRSELPSLTIEELFFGKKVQN
ncbi:helix-turn-helix transcriptional regulator [Hutsoniella sourekii]|uniref:helix-turn-helix transcriptional regulator n=1 Tax=Hutsoniella sourekii TaxID=87650 RepID=UPI000483FA69|nr:helix-turn-helix transcriptional regulator [Hutsoniella sourekii]